MKQTAAGYKIACACHTHFPGLFCGSEIGKYSAIDLGNCEFVLPG
jgi:hypothetical protein